MYVFDVKYQDGEEGTITLDSGAGVSVWPKEWAQYVTRTGPKKQGLKMVAANGTPIENVGQAKLVFKGRVRGGHRALSAGSRSRSRAQRRKTKHGGARRQEGI